MKANAAQLSTARNEVSTERSVNSQLDAVINVIIPSFQILFYQSLKIPLSY
jgi:hypothetical protein